MSRAALIIGAVLAAFAGWAGGRAYEQMDQIEVIRSTEAFRAFQTCNRGIASGRFLDEGGRDENF